MKWQDRFLRQSKILRPAQNNRGVALMIALFFMMIMVFVASQVTFDTNVEYIVSSQEVNRLKAYYAAKAGVEISLLRIAVYKRVMSTAGNQLGPAKSMLDAIWSFPFAWPPSAFIPEDGNISGVDRDLIKTAEKNSMFDVSYTTTISSEAARIDINDVGSTSEELARATQLQIKKIFVRELEFNEEFQKKYRNFDFDRLINNIADWIDEDSSSRNGGNENQGYENLGKDLSGTTGQFIPPNQNFRTIRELHMVAEMKDDFYRLLEPRVTVFGAKGINVNYADRDVLQAIDRQMTDEVVGEVINRRNNLERGGPFKDLQDFQGFIQSLGVNTQIFNQGGVPLLFDAPYNFRIDSIGTFGNVSRRIVAIVYDTQAAATRLGSILNEEDKRRLGAGGQNQPNPPAQPGGTPPTAGQNQGTGQANPAANQNQGRPTVVYWEEN